MPKEFILHPYLWASIDYEYYLRGRSETEGRYQALREQINRLDTEWLPLLNPVSFYLVDWDLSKSSPYNSTVPIWTKEPLVHDWYAILGAAVSRGPEWMRGSLAHYAFKVMKSRDAIEIVIDMGADRPIEISRRLLSGENHGGKGQHVLGLKLGHEIIDSFTKEMEGVRPLFKICGRVKTDRTPPQESGTELAQMLSGLADHAGQTGKFNRPLDSLLAKAQKIVDDAPGLAEAGAHLMAGCTQQEFAEDKGLKQAFMQFVVSLALLKVLTPPDLQWSRLCLVPGVSCIEDNVPEAAEGFLMFLKDDLDARGWVSWLILANLWAREKAVFDLKRKTKRIEQQRSVAKVSHVFSTTLEGVSLLANQIDDASALKAPMLRRVKWLKGMEVFSNYLVNSKRKNEALKGSQKTPPSVLFGQIREIIGEISSILENPAVSDYPRKAAWVKGKNSLYDAVTASLKCPSLKDNELVLWNEYQLYVIIDGLMTNALKYNILGPEAALSVNLELEKDRIYLVVRNNTDLEAGRLRKEIKSLNACSTVDWIGVSLLYAACSACGFDDPRWAMEEGNRNISSIEAKIQIAKTEANK